MSIEEKTYLRRLKELENKIKQVFEYEFKGNLKICLTRKWKIIEWKNLLG